MRTYFELVQLMKTQARARKDAGDSGQAWEWGYLADQVYDLSPNPSSMTELLPSFKVHVDSEEAP